MSVAPLGWLGIARLGVVQACLGAVVVMTTSTLNRIMVVELALPALLPGLLVALHYLVQIVRPRMGHGSDVGGRRTPWLIGGMGVLAVGGVTSAVATVWMASNTWAGTALAVLGFSMIGVGVSACGTSLLVLLAKRVVAPRRAAAATMVWMMMIFGFAVTAGVAGKLLDPYSPERLLAVTTGVSLIAFLATLLVLRGLEGPAQSQPLAAGSSAASAPAKPSFREAMAHTWADIPARRFTIFVFVSMLAFSSQDLILEPFAGSVYGYTPGQSTQLSGVQHSGVLLGMLIVALAGSGVMGRIAARMGWQRSATMATRAASLRAWTAGGCLASALALVGLVAASMSPQAWPLKTTVFLLGAANGAFSIAAIGSMMALAGQGREASEGVRMGLWGAAQAVAFGLGGIVGTGSSDLANWLLGTPSAAYATVFAFEAVLFVLAAGLALWTAVPAKRAAADLSSELASADRSRILPAHRILVRQPRSATSVSPS